MAEYKNILASALVNLGDVVLTTAAVALIKKNFPDARVTMLVKAAAREAVENNPVVDDVIVFDYRAKKNSFTEMQKMAKEIYRRQFDLYISFDRKARPALLAFLARIPVRVGGDRIFGNKKSRVTWLYTDTVKITHDLDATLQCDTYKAVVRGFFDAKGETYPVMARVGDTDWRKADEFFARFGGDGGTKKIALCVKGTFALKTWPKEYFAAVVAELFARHGADFFIVGAKGDRDYADEVIALIKEKAAGVSVLNFCGETTLAELAALFAKCDLLLTVDTGGAHVAAAMGAPMVVMYGCTSPERWHPINDSARVLWTHEPCCPCSVRENGCPSAPHPACLYGVTPAMVLAACEEFLTRPGINDAKKNYVCR